MTEPTYRLHPLAPVLSTLANLLSGPQVQWQFEPDLKQRVYFANHTSHLDAAVLWSALPRPLRARTRPVAGKDYWLKGAIRSYVGVKVFNCLLVDRTPSEGDKKQRAKQVIDELIEGMGEDYSLIIFPEGTRGSGEELAPFKSGMYHLCKAKPGIEAVPVFMENLNRILPKGEFLPVPLMSRVHFGRPLVLGEGEGKDHFLGRSREALLDLVHLVAES